MLLAHRMYVEERAHCSQEYWGHRGEVRIWVREGSREDGVIMLSRGVCGRCNCRRRYGFIADVGAAR